MARDRLIPGQRRIVHEAMQHVVPASDQGATTFDDVATRSGRLCIECKACGRRAVLTREECPHFRPGNKARVRSATFPCGRQGCGSTETRVYSCHDQEEGEMFLAGDPPESYREIPENASWE
jgi:hypothetical protein